MANDIDDWEDLEQKEEWLVDDLQTAIQSLKDSEAKEGIWNKEIIAIQNAIEYLSEGRVM